MQTADSKNIKWNNYASDLLMLLLYFFCLDPLMQWQQTHLSLSCTLLMLLNIAAVGLGCYTFFSAYADDDALIKYKKSLTTFESAALGLSVFISCVGFCWWLAPFAAVKQLGVQETGFIWGAVGYFITFMGVVANTVNAKQFINTAQLSIIKSVNIFITTLFFFFSYAFLLLTLKQWQPSFMAATYLALICLFAFYLPLRFFLLLRPPFHKMEYVSFVFSFGILMIELFARL
jgi:hypothetical protein